MEQNLAATMMQPKIEAKDVEVDRSMERMNERLCSGRLSRIGHP